MPAFQMLWPCKQMLQVACLSPWSPAVAVSPPLKCQLSFSLLRHLDLASLAPFEFIHLASFASLSVTHPKNVCKCFARLRSIFCPLSAVMMVCAGFHSKKLADYLVAAPSHSFDLGLTLLLTLNLRLLRNDWQTKRGLRNASTHAMSSNSWSCMPRFKAEFETCEAVKARVLGPKW